MTMAGIVDDDGVLWKATATPGQFVTKPSPDVDTCWAAIVSAHAKYPNVNAVGERPVLSTSIVDGMPKLTLGPYSYITFSTYYERICDFGSGLSAVANLEKGERVIIYADTQLAWMLAAFGCWRQGYVVGTIYSTLGEEGAEYGINQSESKVIIADAKLLKVLGNIVGKCKNLKRVIALTDEAANSEGATKLRDHGVTVTSLGEVEKHGRESRCEPSPSAPSDVAVLMYTSGTTGNPKGVLLTHENVTSLIGGVTSKTGVVDSKFLCPGNRYLAYLPLAHIMELAVELALLASGVTLGYGGVGTFIPTAPKMLQTTPPQQGDAQALQPTFLVAAPAVLDRIFSVVSAKIRAAPGPLKSWFEYALSQGAERFDVGGVGANPCVGVIFKPVQKLLGGQVNLILTGSAPLGAATQKFIQTAFACPVRQGYGLTETTAGTCIALADDNSVGVVGPPQECACILLRDWEEGNYRNADQHDPKIGMRRGEVLIGGPMVCQGYLVSKKNPDKEVVAKNANDFVTIKGIRYFCTGDVGQYTPEGNLMIIDRKKDLVKLQHGEYVALSKVENVLKACKLVAMPCVYARSSMKYCIAMICVVEPALRALATELGVNEAGVALDALCKEPKLAAAALAELQGVCKAAKLTKYESPEKVVLVAELWTPDNGMLTAVNKLKRKDIEARHLAEINAVYT